MKRKMVLALGAAAFLTLAPSLNTFAMEEEAVQELAEQIGEEYGICPELLQAVAWQESRYQEDAESDGCSGLMQIAECWHKDRMDRLGVADLHDPAGNMRVAADYMKELAERYEDIGMALMVYNGDSHVRDYQETGQLSEYALSILEMSAALEQEHGK